MSGLYGSRWQRARLVFLAENALCAFCQREGRTTAATIVDHVVPHKGDVALFWDIDNWQALCASHHDNEKRAAERGTIVRSGCDADGIPLDPNHHWNRAATPIHGQQAMRGSPSRVGSGEMALRARVCTSRTRSMRPRDRRDRSVR